MDAADEQENDDAVDVENRVHELQAARGGASSSESVLGWVPGQSLEYAQHGRRSRCGDTPRAGLRGAG